jgi:acyl dehydratase
MTIDEFAKLAGQDLGHSDWMMIDQDRIDGFAAVTEDHQFIHVEPARAAVETPFGGTIAHGFLTLSLLSHLNAQILPDIDNRVMTFNYGMNKVRFLHPVACGARVRSKVHLASVTEKDPGRYLCVLETQMEIEGQVVPALIAEQLVMHVITK